MKSMNTSGDTRKDIFNFQYISLFGKSKLNEKLEFFYLYL